MLGAHRPSSVRQYESCWKRFQDYLRRQNLQSVSEGTVLDFLTWLAESTNRAPATVMGHYAALADPLYFALGIKVPERTLKLFKRGLRAGAAPSRAPTPAWSLHRALHYLAFEGVVMEEDHFLQRATFLLALASGYRASQLAALSRHEAFARIERDMTAVTLSPSPTFLAKNEQADDLIGPLRIPSFLRDGGPHPLCPVRAFKDYIECTEGASKDHLFYNSRSGKPLHPRSIARLLCRVIETADPGHSPKAHSIRGLAASLAFIRTHSVERVQDLGGWASASSFRMRYLYHSVSSTACVAMGTAPTLSDPLMPSGSALCPKKRGGRGRPRGGGRPRGRRAH